MSSEIPSVHILNGDIFQFTSGLLVIPRSTTGTIDTSFQKGLKALGIDYPLKDTILGEVTFLWNVSKRYPDLHLAFATSVGSNSSDYKSISIIASTLYMQLSEQKISTVYCPMLGTGAGGLNPFFCYVYLVMPFLKQPNPYQFNIVVFEKSHYEHLDSVQRLNSYALTQSCIQRIFDSIAKDQSIQEVMISETYFFQLAQDSVNALLRFSISANVKQMLLDNFKNFKGNFQEFIDSYSETKEREFLLLVGEVITYLDTRAYHRNVWNKYDDKRAIARAGVYQGDWVRGLLNFSIHQEVSQLPPNIRNAINYVLNPAYEFPILSERDRRNIISAITNVEYTSDLFNTTLREYFDILRVSRPINPLNNTALIARIIYSSLVKLLWDPDSRKINTKKSNEGQEAQGISQKNGISSEDEVPGDKEPEVSKTNKTKTYKARLHDDRHAEEDLLDYELYAQTIVNFIKHEDTQAPLTIGVFAPWGMGKTSLMRFIERKLKEGPTNSGKTIVNEITNTLKARMIAAIQKIKGWLGIRRTGKNHEHLTIEELLKELKKPSFGRPGQPRYNYPTIWFNAWKYDNTEQILSGLAFEIITQLVEKLPNQVDRERFYVNLNKKRFNEKKMMDDVRSKIHSAIFNKVSVVLLVGCLISIPVVFYILASSVFYWGSAALGLGGIIKALTKWGREKTADAAKYFNSFVKQPEYEKKLGYFHEVEADMKNVFDCMVDKENPCVIFIDDLDRCSSKKVVEVIEAINLFISGDFPNCYFVIGMDAQMVAASIEAEYSDIDRRLSSVQKVHGSLGWYFLEKFVQLQFIIPNLSDQAGRSLLRKLFEEKKQPALVKPDKIDTLKSKAQMIDVTEKEALNELGAQLESVSEEYKDDVLAIKSALIDRAAKEYTDTEKEAAALLENYAQYLNVSPRVIKRFANLFRFYRFMQMANLTNRMRELEEPEIAQMVILSLRWPQLPRLIQWNTESDIIEGVNGLDRASYLDERFEKGWSTKLGRESIQWIHDENLKDFLNKNRIKLRRYVELGVW